MDGTVVSTLRTSEEARSYIVDLYLVLESARNDLPTREEVEGFGEIGLRLKVREDVEAAHEPVLLQLEEMFRSTYVVDRKMAVREEQVRLTDERLEGRFTTRTREKLVVHRTMQGIEGEALQHRVMMMCSYIERRLVELIKEMAQSPLLKILRKKRDARRHALECKRRAAHDEATQSPQYIRLKGRLQNLPRSRAACIA